MATYVPVTVDAGLPGRIVLVGKDQPTVDRALIVAKFLRTATGQRTAVAVRVPDGSLVIIRADLNRPFADPRRFNA